MAAPRMGPKRYTAKTACFAARVPHVVLNGWARSGELRKLSLVSKSGAWRRYSEEDIAIVAMIGRLKEIGFDLRDAVGWATFAAGERRKYGDIGEMTVLWYAHEGQHVRLSISQHIPLPPGKPEISLTVNVDGIYESVKARLIADGNRE